MKRDMGQEIEVILKKPKVQGYRFLPFRSITNFCFSFGWKIKVTFEGVSVIVGKDWKKKKKEENKQIMWVTTMLIEKNNWTDDIDVTVG